MRKFFILLASSYFLITSSGSNAADSYGFIDVIVPVEKSELWLNLGLASYHSDQSQDFNAVNYGIGGEYRFSTVASVTVGTYRNSNYHQSNYIGAYWQPIAIGPVNIGLVAGGFNGYSGTNNGGWFPAVLPALTVEGEWVGLNLMIIPTIPNRVSGSLSFQIKFKVFDGVSAL